MRNLPQSQGTPLCPSSRDYVCILSVESQMEEFMYLGLRKVEGVSRTDFQNCFGKNVDDVYGKILDKLEEEQLLEFSGDRIRLTHRGMDVSNCVLAEFLF